MYETTIWRSDLWNRSRFLFGLLLVWGLNVGGKWPANHERSLLFLGYFPYSANMHRACERIPVRTLDEPMRYIPPPHHTYNATADIAKYPRTKHMSLPASKSLCQLDPCSPSSRRHANNSLVPISTIAMYRNVPATMA
jgi:hypothetical protein